MNKIDLDALCRFTHDHWRLYACEEVNGKNLRMWVNSNGKFVVDYNSKHLYNDYEIRHAVECYNEIIEKAENEQAHT